MLVERFADMMPGWLAWPASAASTVTAVVAAVFVFFAAMNGEWTPVYWAGIFFVIAAVLWHVADMASANRTY
ncbi:MAG: hypothetical protein R3290_02050 [Acidimicrobiia bacterium]|nr:hypothetical protein [Acidimicrobiia bacterium]